MLFLLRLAAHLLAENERKEVLICYLWLQYSASSTLFVLPTDIVLNNHATGGGSVEKAQNKISPELTSSHHKNRFLQQYNGTGFYPLERLLFRKP